MVKAASQSKTRVRLNSAMVKRAQKILGAKTETAAIEQALDFVIAESENNRLAFEANERLPDTSRQIVVDGRGRPSLHSHNVDFK